MRTLSFTEIQKKIRSLNHSALLQQTRQLALEERRISIEFLHHLLELDRRRLFVPKFSSLHEYVVSELGYSDGAAHRRISAMRLLRTVPELEPKLRDGSVNLSTASQVQNFMNAERRIHGLPIRPQVARELVEQISGKSARETESLLAARSPQVAAALRERPRHIDGQNIHVSIVLRPELQDKLRRLRDRMAHRHPHPSLAEQLEMLADFALRKLEGRPGAPSSDVRASAVAVPAATETPRRSPGADPSPATPEPPAPSPAGNPMPATAEDSDPAPTTTRENSEVAPSRNRSRRTGALIHHGFIGGPSRRAIAPRQRRQVWSRAGAQCEFRHPDGSRCSRTHLLQIDHRIPVAWGGGRESSNLQLLCATHNRWKSDRLPGE